MYALHCGLLPLNTSSPLSVTTCHISAPPLLYLSRAAGLSRLSCVTDFRIATAFYPCGGRAPSNRPGLVCLLAVPPITALQFDRLNEMLVVKGLNDPAHCYLE